MMAGNLSPTHVLPQDQVVWRLVSQNPSGGFTGVLDALLRRIARGELCASLSPEAAQSTLDRTDSGGLWGSVWRFQWAEGTVVVVLETENSAEGRLTREEVSASLPSLVLSDRLPAGVKRAVVLRNDTVNTMTRLSLTDVLRFRGVDYEEVATYDLVDPLLAYLGFAPGRAAFLLINDDVELDGEALLTLLLDATDRLYRRWDIARAQVESGRLAYEKAAAETLSD